MSSELQKKVVRHIPKSKVDATQNLGASLQPRDIIGKILTSVFTEFLSDTGKYRRNIDAFPFGNKYYYGSTDSTIGRNNVSIKVQHEFSARELPGIYFVLGLPRKQNDLNKGFETPKDPADQGRVLRRQAYTVPTTMFIGSTSEGVAQELTMLVSAIFETYIKSIYGGVISNRQSSYQLCFPRNIAASDTLSTDIEQQSNVEKIYYAEYSFEFFFEQLYLDTDLAPIKFLYSAPQDKEIVLYEESEEGKSVIHEDRLKQYTRYQVKIHRAGVLRLTVSDESKALIHRVAEGSYYMQTKAMGEVILTAHYDDGTTFDRPVTIVNYL